MKSAIKNILKYLVSLIALGYVGYRLYHTPFSISEIKAHISLPILGVCFVLALGNWFFEFLKWKLVINTFSPISFFTAANQTLVAFAYGLLTPLNSGSYLKKIFYYPKKFHKRVVLLNIYKGLYQMLTTVIFGVWGIYILIHIVDFSFFDQQKFVLSVGIIVTVLALIFRKKLIQYLTAISLRVHLKLFLYSMIKYLCFSSIIFLLLKKPEVNNIALYAGIGVIYLLSSLLPVFNILDFAIKGSLALFTLGPLGFTELEILICYFILWVYNHALPAIAGSIIQFYPNPKITI